MDQPTLLTHEERGILTLTLNRPAVRNALDEALIEALHATCEAAAARSDVRAVVLCGSGPAFCSGADLGWMTRTTELDPEANRADARRFARMLSALWKLPQPLVGSVHGAVVGGGIGLVAACDHVLASSDTHFQFREARVGLVPATIGPLVAAKVGAAAASLFLTACRFDAARARELGLVHEVADDLQASLLCLLDDLRAGGPEALRRAKKLARDLMLQNTDPMQERLLTMADLLAEVRATEEAREGFRAFREKRPPRWVEENL